MENEIRLFIADDHPILRDGIRRMVTNHPDIKVVGEADSGKKAIDGILAVKPDVIIMDISMPEKDGVQVMQAVLKKRPSSRIIFYSMHPEHEYAIKLMQMGASGFINKSSGADNLVDAIRRVHHGEKYFSQAVINNLIHQMRPTRVSSKTKRSKESDMVGLTNREFGILHLIGNSHGTTEIASRLSLSVKTVSTHTTNIIQKLGVKNKMDLVHYCISNGIVQ